LIITVPTSAPLDLS